MLIQRMISVTALFVTLGVPALAGPQEAAPAQITDQDLLAGLKNPSRWLTFSGDYTGQRHSPLKQLTPRNVAGLPRNGFFKPISPAFPGAALRTRRWSSTAYCT
ncbi:MAG TPA: hypothetical protein VK770_12830 [Candidatus Acidoferrum sp.]|jgi:glucose dehydrogenase|nr:hypothetical protein [Candidatus Acidoferrum sp.]